MEHSTLHYVRVFRYVVLCEYWRVSYNRAEVLTWDDLELERRISDLERKFHLL